MNKVTVWSVTKNNKTKFGVGRRPKGSTFVGEFVKLYDPNTGTMSDTWSYQAARYAQQPPARWLYERTPVR